MPDVLLVSAAVTGLLAGLYLAFSLAVMPGLARAGDDVFVDGMRSINLAIRNPVFGAMFIGSPVLAVVAALLGATDALRWIAAVLAIAALVITLAVNIPLNARLDAATESASVARGTFERPWNIAHAIRTVALVLSFVAALGATVV